MAPVLDLLLKCPRNVVWSMLVLISYLLPNRSWGCSVNFSIFRYNIFFSNVGLLSHLLVTMLVWWQVFSSKIPCSLSCCQISSTLASSTAPVLGWRTVGEVVNVNQRWVLLLSRRCVQYYRHCWNYGICGFLVFDSWIQFKKMYEGELLLYGEMLYGVMLYGEMLLSRKLRTYVVFNVLFYTLYLWYNGNILNLLLNFNQKGLKCN